jgi:hypothetical protein
MAGFGNRISMAGMSNTSGRRSARSHRGRGATHTEQKCAADRCGDLMAGDSRSRQAAMAVPVLSWSSRHGRDVCRRTIQVAGAGGSSLM